MKTSMTSNKTALLLVALANLTQIYASVRPLFLEPWARRTHFSGGDSSIVTNGVDGQGNVSLRLNRQRGARKFKCGVRGTSGSELHQGRQD